MNKETTIIVIIAILAGGYILFFSNTIFDIEGSSSNPTSPSALSLTFPTLQLPQLPSPPLASEVWQVFQDYLSFAQAHNLAGLRSLSHQISDTCNDPSKETECFALMDNVYAIASPLQLSDFPNIQSDGRQIILYTDGPLVATLFFTRDTSGAPKVLGLKFCLENETTERCVETNPNKRDLDGNGWWDNVESLFY